MNIPEEVLNKISYNASLAGYSEEEDKKDFRNPTYNLVSRLGYLIGVDKRLFEDPTNPAMMIKVYDKLNSDKNARIIRNLCRVRTGIEKYYMAIVQEFNHNFKNIDSVPDLIDAESVRDLSNDGVTLYKTRPNIDQYLITINTEIASKISNCKHLFPEWLKWEYVKTLFIMPKGTKVEGIKAEGNYYNSDRNRYPYQCYINFEVNCEGNLLYCDEKLINALYSYHNDYFSDYSLVRSAGDAAKSNIHEFLTASEKCIMVVDCENSNPIKLAGMFHSLTEEEKSNIYKVLMFDGDYSTSGWQILFEQNMTGVKTDYEVVKRIYESKSQVDMTLAVEATREVFQNGVDSIILVSSDSDYWAMIKSLPEVNFMMMIEKEKSGLKIREKLELNGIRYCFIDDFNTAQSYSIKTETIKRYIEGKINENLAINMEELLDEAVRNSWVDMTKNEKNQFFEKYIRKARVVVDRDGVLSIEMGT